MRQVGAEIFHTVRGMTKPIVAFRSFTSTPNNQHRDRRENSLSFILLLISTFVIQLKVTTKKD